MKCEQTIQETSDDIMDTERELVLLNKLISIREESIREMKKQYNYLEIQQNLQSKLLKTNEHE